MLAALTVSKFVVGYYLTALLTEVFFVPRIFNIGSFLINTFSYVFIRIQSNLILLHTVCYLHFGKHPFIKFWVPSESAITWQ
jgi:hypothetical protein